MTPADRLLQADHRAAVHNIALAAAAGTFNVKVEAGDPQLSGDAQKALLTQYASRRSGLTFRSQSLGARELMNVAGRVVTRDVRISGQARLASIPGGAIVTSNHFSPLENLFVRRTVAGHRLRIVSQLTNFAMTGFTGYFMRYGDTIPVSGDREWFGRQFPGILQDALDARQWVLIYPEQEMWFNYRKPRPLQRGAYYYAARFGVPVVSLFVSMYDTGRPVSADFNAVRYAVEVLPVLWPKPELDVRAASKDLQRRDTVQKAAAYARAYGHEPADEFSPRDIAGWRHDWC